MSEVEQIETRIQGLSPEDLARFRRWFLDFDAHVWDQQIEDDSRSGRLDGLVAESVADYEAGKARDL
ncbi:MAG TPA: hypothetical protein VKY89_07580 [Thermoanaerobaculia bacterium]|jgi:hypothetical protein|nr:hypothetical protein [Thermoanaerobaculia bacterium]